jgi:hypothetical protein
MLRTGLLLIALFLVTACEQNPNHVRVSAAGVFTDRYSESSLSKWKVRANAAGADCSVLLIETGVLLDDTLVESLHYGAGDSDLWAGGVQQFCRERAFSGVVYRDRAGRVWTYGEITPLEAGSLEACH